MLCCLSYFHLPACCSINCFLQAYDLLEACDDNGDHELTFSEALSHSADIAANRFASISVSETEGMRINLNSRLTFNDLGEMPWSVIYVTFNRNPSLHHSRIEIAKCTLSFRTYNRLIDLGEVQHERIEDMHTHMADRIAKLKTRMRRDEL